jgi:hypothetical protein
LKNQVDDLNKFWEEKVSPKKPAQRTEVFQAQAPAAPSASDLPVFDSPFDVDDTDEAAEGGDSQKEEGGTRSPAATAVLPQSIDAGQERASSPFDKPPVFDDIPSLNSTLGDTAENAEEMMAEISTMTLTTSEEKGKHAEDAPSPVIEFLSARGEEEGGAPAALGTQYAASSPTTRQVIQSVSSSLTDTVIETVLFASRDSMHRRERALRPSRDSRPPLLTKQNSNMSVVSTTSTENAGGRPTIDANAEAEAGAGLDSVPVSPLAASSSNNSSGGVKAAERLERALEFAGDGKPTDTKLD